MQTYLRPLQVMQGMLHTATRPAISVTSAPRSASYDRVQNCLRVVMMAMESCLFPWTTLKTEQYCNSQFHTFGRTNFIASMVPFKEVSSTGSRPSGVLVCTSKRLPFAMIRFRSVGEVNLPTSECDTNVDFCAVTT